MLLSGNSISQCANLFNIYLKLFFLFNFFPIEQAEIHQKKYIETNTKCKGIAFKKKNNDTYKYYIHIYGIHL